MQEEFINEFNFEGAVEGYRNAIPFNHVVIDNFLNPSVAEQVAKEFPDFEDESWRIYDNQIEVKKLQNHWDKFGAETYKLLTYLNSREFISKLELLVGEPLYADVGLNGGGLHSHKKGGKLNVHLDYSIHPKLELERRINLLIYVTKDWKSSWGGTLGLWAGAPSGDGPGELMQKIDCTFNRAVLFDTTQNSWHGLPEPIDCPEDIYRNSIAVYYLCEPRARASTRGKALFAPYKDQANDPAVLELIKKRASVQTAADTYQTKKK